MSARVFDELVSRDYRISICFLDTADGSEAERYRRKYQDKLQSYVRVYNSNNVRSVKNMVVSMCKRQPLNVYRNSCDMFRKVIEEELAEQQIDKIYCDHLEMMQYIPPDYQQRTVLFEHNVEFMIWKRYSVQMSNLILKAGICFEAIRMKNYELKQCKKVGNVLAAPSDIQFLKSKDNTADRNKYIAIHQCGNDVLLNYPDLTKKKSFQILFVATMTWQANIDGINWFIKEALPFITKEYPDVKVNVAGRLPDSYEKKMKQDVHVKYCGFVKEIENYYANTTVFICPLLYGSGTKIKVVDALYRGVPLVTTSIGAENIDLVNGKNAFIADTGIMFAKCIIRLWEDDAIWNQFVHMGRELARKDFMWKAQIDKICSCLDAE